MPSCVDISTNLSGNPSPRGELAARTLAMPADTNPAGDVFGGWIMAQMDAAGAITATRLAEGRVVTVAVTDVVFLEPVKVGDVVCFYAEPVRRGTTSVTLHIETWVLRQGRGERVKVTAAEYTFVALDETGTPRPVTREALLATAPEARPGEALGDRRADGSP